MCVSAIRRALIDRSIGSFLASFVALGDNAYPDTAPNAIDGDLQTHTTMGNNALQPDMRIVALADPHPPSRTLGRKTRIVVPFVAIDELCEDVDASFFYTCIGLKTEQQQRWLAQIRSVNHTTVTRDVRTIDLA